MTPTLRAVGRSEHLAPASQRSFLDPQTRECLRTAIRDMARVYGLEWFMRRHTMHVHYALEHLTDEELVALEKKIDSARECLRDGVSFDEAGLI